MKAIEYMATVQSIKDITPTVYDLHFTVDNPLTFKAGQFVSVIIPGAGPKGRDLRRAYSIASSPDKTPIELCVKLVEGGPGTNYLYSLKPSQTFKIFAPYGDFVYKPKPSRNVYFCATGTGIAPFRSMIQSEEFWKSPPKSITCVFGVREKSELLYDSEFRDKKEVLWIPCLSRSSGDWAGYKGRITDFMREDAKNIDWLNTDFYLCGNGEMITEIKAILTEKGLTKESIHQEKYY